MTLAPELCAVAQRVVWFETPQEALHYPNRFLAYLMTYGTLEEILIVKRYFSDQDFKSALLDAPPGIFDIRSWTYWNLVYGREPVPPMPKRSIPESV